jgi:uncharacterized protein YjbI with pentapeptide repeats
MILPKRAPVRPRIFAPVSGEAILLEHEIRRLADGGGRGIVVLLGEAGAGKTTALQHLAAVLRSRGNVVFLDEADIAGFASAGPNPLIIYAARSVQGDAPDAAYRLVPWGDDDLIEYLLAVHKERCASVMARLRPGDRELCRELPELWRAALDQLAGDDTVPDVRAALRRHVAGYLQNAHLADRTRSACLWILTAEADEEPSILARLGKDGAAEGLLRVLRHRSIQLLLAAEKIAKVLGGDGDCVELSLRLPRDLVQATAVAIAGDEHCRDRLFRLLEGPASNHAMAASIVHAAGYAWKPQAGVAPALRGAYLEGVAWHGVSLAKADLIEADLSAADVCEADLTDANAHKAALSGAQLTGAVLKGLKAIEADLSSADLPQVRAEDAEFHAANLDGATLEASVLAGASFRGAKLTRAILRGADLTRAVLSEAQLEEADFTDANLTSAQLSGLRLNEAIWTGASFAEAQMARCDLEGLQLPDANFQGANLQGALLTGCVMPGANFDRANLKEAGLGDVEWEGVSLRGADLRGATFHMGSSRSGLVGSPIACEGSRTGFYTDDYEEQSYKAPEEIRKANLCRADLRGGRLDDVDFYLVDLRGALYDSRYKDHLRRCGAILHSRVEG